MYRLRRLGRQTRRALRQAVVQPLGGASRHPVWPARYTVIELATGIDHRTFDSEAEVGACLAFAKLEPDDVEIVSDASPMARFTGWA